MQAFLQSKHRLNTWKEANNSPINSKIVVNLKVSFGERKAFYECLQYDIKQNSFTLLVYDLNLLDHKID